MRIPSLDFLKFFLALMVVGLHAGIFVEHSPNVSFFLVNGVFRVAVPLFFIMAGFFFSEVIAGRQNFVRWCFRLLGLYLIWMTLYSPVYVFWNKNFDLKGFAVDFFIGYWHLWYVPSLVLSGIFLYSFKSIYFSRYSFVFAVLCFVFGACLQYYFLINCDSAEMPFPVYRNFLFFGFPMFYIGCRIRSIDLIGLTDGKLNYCLFFFGILFFFEIFFVRFCLGVNANVDIYFSLILFCPLVFLRFGALNMASIDWRVVKFSNFLYFFHPVGLLLFGRLHDYSRFDVFLLTILLTVLVFIFLSKNKKIINFLS